MILIICIGVFLLQLLAAIVLVVSKNILWYNPVLEDAKPHLDKLTVLIPFCNELNRIHPLVAYLNKTTVPSNVQLLFIDDHSTDDTAAYLEKHLTAPYECIKNGYAQGKKYALLAGVEKAEHPYILTLDADVVPPKNYLTTVVDFPQADLIILPVKMNGANLISRFGSIEFTFLQTLGFGSSGFGQHSLCNGANLVFSKATFLELQPHRTDYDHPSGDDYFLLQAMRKANKNIRVFSHHFKKQGITVNTPAPESLAGLLAQRRRWLGKVTTGGLTVATVVAGVLLALVQFTFLLCVILLFTNKLYLIPLIVKFGAEYTASFQYIKTNVKRIIALALFQFWYPFFLVQVLFFKKKNLAWRVKA